MKRANFSIRSRDDATRLIRDAAAQNLEVAWSDRSGRSGSSRIALEDGHLALCVDGADAPDDTAELTFSLYGLPIHIHCRVSAERIISPIDGWSSDHRDSPRVAPSHAIHLEWYAVENGALRVHRSSFREVGAHGGRTFHPAGGEVPSGDVFPAVVSFGDSSLSCMVEVRSRRTTELGVELGLKLHADGPSQLSDTLLANLFPRMTLRRHLPERSMVELFERSGYLKLREGCIPCPAWLRLSADAVTRDFVYMSSGSEPIGHGSITRAYRHTWIAHQVATLSHHPETFDARRDLYLAMNLVPTLMDGSAAHLIAYYDRSRSWHKALFEEFERSVDAPLVTVTTGLCRFERDNVPLELAPVLTEDTQIDIARPGDLAAVTSLARSWLPSLLADALDLFPSSLQSADLHTAYRENGLVRERTVLVARHRGQIVAAALCEHTSRELSLFNILNIAYLFVASTDVPAELQRALQHRVRSYYRERGIAEPLVVAPEHNFDATLSPHVRLAEVMGCIAWSAKGLRAYENYIMLRCAWLQQEKRLASGSARSPRSSSHAPEAERA
jgi:hypothetical protein